MIYFSLKVNEWAEGKRGNIRALLCSLHLILWEEESRWKPCGMHNLVQPDQVTYSYADTYGLLTKCAVKIYWLLTKCKVKMAGCWPSSFFECLWTETESRSINSHKKNKANIQPS